MREGRLGIGVARCPERGDEQLRRDYFAGRPLDYLQRRAGVVDEQPLASHMRLAHRRRQAAFPDPIQLTETAIAVAVRMRGAVLLPEQLQCNALPPQLAMDRWPVRPRPPRLDRGQRRRHRK